MDGLSVSTNELFFAQDSPSEMDDNAPGNGNARTFDEDLFLYFHRNGIFDHEACSSLQKTKKFIWK
jgi:hypothetical protein